MSEKQQYVMRPEDRERRVLSLVESAAEQMLQQGHWVRVEVSRWKKAKTPPQNRTLWQWHTEVASQLTERCRSLALSDDRGRLAEWSREEVHEIIFKPRMMPYREKVTPDGVVHPMPMGTSDPECTAEVLSEAMEKYLAWIAGEGMEVTVPDSAEQYLRGRVAG